MIDDGLRLSYLSLYSSSAALGSLRGWIDRLIAERVAVGHFAHLELGKNTLVAVSHNVHFLASCSES